MINWELSLNLENHLAEEYSDHVRYPLYFDNYVDAVRNIFFRIILEKKENEREKEYVRKIVGKEIGDRDNSNIISFIGERGTGKTTAMNEFCRILSSLNEQKEQNWWLEKVIPEDNLRMELSRDKLSFRVLKPIDASSLHVKEDLFEIIVANIYREFERYIYKDERVCFNEEDSFRYKKALKHFAEIIDNYYAVRNARKEEFNDSVITKIKHMSSSLNIRSEIDKLLSELFNVWNYDNSNCFLVIAIDDLDLNIVNGYEMLDQLHKYFINKHIILVVALDYKQMTQICEMRYYREFTQNGLLPVGDNINLYTDVLKQCQCLARDYITKVLPINNRIFIPSMEKMTRKIVVDETGKGDIEVSAKKFILRKIARKMYIYHDSVGKKQHFAEAKSIREMVTYNQFLDSMNEIDFSQIIDGIDSPERKELGHFYDLNHEKYNKDIMNRIVRKCLSEKYCSLFDELCKKELTRRAKYFCSMASRRIYDSKGELESPQDYDERAYTYAGLLETIYELGRISNMDKSFIRCILAYFTSEMVREYLALNYSSDEDKAVVRERINSFLGNSFGGEWTEEMVPYWIDGFPVAYNANAETSWIRLCIAAPVTELMQELEGILKLRKDTSIHNKLVPLETWLSEQKIVPTLECFSALFALPENKSIIFKLSMDPLGKLWIRGERQSVTLDVFGFVKQSFEYKDTVEFIHNMIVTALLQMIEEYLKAKGVDVDSDKYRTFVKDNLKEVLVTFVKNQSLYSEEYSSKNLPAIPFYNLDLTYNLIKRVRNACIKENPAYLQENKACFDYIKKIYAKIAFALDEQKENYGDDYEYGDIFKNYPYIKAMLDYEHYLNLNFPELLGQLIYQANSPMHLTDIDLPEFEIE